MAWDYCNDFPLLTARAQAKAQDVSGGAYTKTYDLGASLTGFQGCWYCTLGLQGYTPMNCYMLLLAVSAASAQSLQSHAVLAKASSGVLRLRPHHCGPVPVRNRCRAMLCLQRQVVVC